MKQRFLSFPLLILLSGFQLFLYSCEQAEPPILTIVPGKSFGWNPIILNINENLNDIYFVNENAGWIVGENQILLSTTSGDIGWSLAPVDLPLENLRGVFFIDDQLGWIAGDLSGGTNKGQVGYSGSGGGYPVQLETFENSINSLYFTDSKTGWVAGEGGLLAKTQDGGYTWQLIPLFTDNSIHDLYFIDDLTGWASGGNGIIFYSKDGISWEKEDTGIESDIFAVYFIDELHGWACGGNNTILIKQVSDDNASGWIRTTIEEEFASMEWRDIFFISSLTGWVAGQFGNLYKTTDGGLTWDKEKSNVNSTLNAIHMINGNKGWVVGDNGIIISYGSE